MTQQSDIKAAQLVADVRDDLEVLVSEMCGDTPPGHRDCRARISSASLKLDKARVLLREGDISGTREET